MIVNPAELHKDMIVFSVSGEEIGCVVSVSGSTGSEETADGLGLDPDVPMSVVAEGAMPGLLSHHQGFLVVDHHGLLGLGTTHLRVPLESVVDITPGETLTVSCTRGECQELPD